MVRGGSGKEDVELWDGGMGKWEGGGRWFGEFLQSPESTFAVTN